MSNLIALSIEDIDGDLVEVSGETSEGLVTITINLNEELAAEADSDAFYSEVTPTDARTLAAGLMLAALQAEGKALGF